MKNKEMLYIKQNGECYMNKEDKIKELAKDMGIGFQLSGTTRFGPVAAELVEMGYQRIKKDDIIISKEEYSCLKSIEKSYDPFWFCTFGGCEGVCKECKDTCEMSIFVKERKKILEKFIKECKKYKVEKFSTVGIDQQKTGVSWIEMPEWKFDEFIKQFNIDIKD